MIDMAGQTHHGVYVVESAGADKRGERRWLCRCYCGKTFVAGGYDIRTGHSKTCGQHRSEQTTKNKTIHGYTGTKVYSTWKQIHRRCKVDPDYAGRGISVCERWNSFENFLEDMGEPLGGRRISIGRINNDLGYTPENCRWETPFQQANNTRMSRLVAFRGRIQTIAQWADEFDIPRQTLRNRYLKQGLPFYKSLGLAAEGIVSQGYDK